MEVKIELAEEEARFWAKQTSNGHPTNAALIEGCREALKEVEPPVGSIVQDNYGACFERQYNGWYAFGNIRSWTWNELVANYDSLTRVTIAPMVNL